MQSIPASCLELHVCYEWQILSYLSAAVQTRLYPKMSPCTSRLWPSPSDLISQEPNSRGNVDKYFSAEFDFDRSLTIIISLTSPQARAMKSSRHTDPTQGALHCCFTTSWVSLYGITLACWWQTMTMKMFCSWLTVPMLCCHNTCQLNIIWWRPVFAHAGGCVMQIWSHNGHT